MYCTDNGVSSIADSQLLQHWESGTVFARPHRFITYCTYITRESRSSINDYN
jgi:hypothetical protein